MLEFWFEFGSTYSYPAAMRIEALAASRGVPVHWRPFLLGPIFKAQGWNDSPFNLYPAKGAYMWRDLARICAKFELPLRRPSVFPRNGLTAARIAAGFADEAWVPEFVRRVYSANFARDRDISESAALLECLSGLVDLPERILAEAGSETARGRLRAATEEAVARGIFGAPSFTVGDELYWGNDRLEEALEHASTVIGVR